MRAFIFIFVALSVALTRQSAPGGEMSEERAVQLVRHLPEFIAYARTRECMFDDNELITERSTAAIPANIRLPAWRIDVHIVIDDVVTKHLSLWHRFMVSASGDIFVWQIAPADRFISLAEWRKVRKT